MGGTGFATIVKAAEARLREAGYLLVVASTGNDPGRERAAAAEFRGRRVDGMLVAPGSDANAKAWRALVAAGTPVVIVDRDAPKDEDEDEDGVRWPAVQVDHRGGARAATRYLLGLGHLARCQPAVGQPQHPGRGRAARGLGGARPA